MISRFVNYEFRMGGQRERAAYLKRLARARRKVNLAVLAFVLMSSHIHLILLAREDRLDAFFRSLNTAFGRWWNEEHDGYGPVFAERPWWKIIDTQAGLIRNIAYVHTNPDRAGLVACPSHSRWTSHRATIGLDPVPGFLDVETSMSLMGFANTPRGRREFHEVVRTRRHLPRDPIVAGPGTSSVEIADGLIAACAESLDVGIEEICKPPKELAQQRLKVIATATQTFGCSVDHVAKAFGCSPSYLSRLRRQAVGHQCDALVDAYLEREAMIRETSKKEAS